MLAAIATSPRLPNWRVLEPFGALPVIIDDDVLCWREFRNLYEGTIVKRRAVLGTHHPQPFPSPSTILVRAAVYSSTTTASAHS